MKEERLRETADERTLHQTEGVNRIVDFANGVMGFAITLLVIDIKVPEVQSKAEALPAELLALWPQYIAYLASFYIIGENWIIYSRIFSHIERYDERLYWLNLLFLLFIAVLPFPTSLVSAYPDRKLPALLYAGAVTCVVFARTLLWWYATKNHRLVHKTLDVRFIRGTLRNALMLLGGFAISVIIAFFSPFEAISIWIILAIVALVTRFRLYRPPKRDSP